MHIPKTAGASVGQMCMAMGFAGIGHNLRDLRYVSLAQYRKQHPQILSFTVVRNPWDRLVSAYHFLAQGGLNPQDTADAERFVSPYRNFNEFVANAFTDNAILDQLHFRPQYQWISDESGLVVDFVGRFESLQQDISRFLELTGLPDYRLPHVNRAEHKDYRQYYSGKSIEIVAAAYARDVELFGYSYDQ